MNKYQTINTFNQIPSIAQIISYIVFISQTALFYAVAVPNFKDNTALIIITIFFSISIIFLIIFAIISSCIDPSDNLMIQYRNGNIEKIKNQLDDALYCELCKSYVKQNSRHCRTCHRCVQQFDHHCIWINNCIGGKNYKYFFIMICSTQINLSLYIIAIVYISVQNNWMNFLVGMVLAWIVLAIVAVLWFLLINLIFLHIYLRFNGLTTYQFIIAQRIQKQLKEKKKIQRQEQQLAAQLENKNGIVNYGSQTNKKIEQNNLYKQQQKKPSQSNNKQQLSRHYFYRNDRRQKTQATHANILNRQQNNIQTLDPNKTETKLDVVNIFQGQMQAQHQPSFGQKQPTQKSQGQVSHNQYRKNNDKNIKESIQFQNQSDNNSSIHFSQFFMRNKSLKLLVGDAQADRPSIKSSKAQEMKNQKNDNKNININSSQVGPKKDKLVPKQSLWKIQNDYQKFQKQKQKHISSRKQQNSNKSKIKTSRNFFNEFKK